MKLLLLCFSCLFASIAFSQVQYLKEDFYNQKVVGSGQLLHPTSIRFDEIGQGYITLKRGVVRVVDTTGLLLPEPLIDISEEVIGSGDHGLVSIALDPVSYTHLRAHETGRNLVCRLLLEKKKKI